MLAFRYYSRVIVFTNIIIINCGCIYIQVLLYLIRIETVNKNKIIVKFNHYTLAINKLQKYTIYGKLSRIFNN